MLLSSTRLVILCFFLLFVRDILAQEFKAKGERLESYPLQLMEAHWTSIDLRKNRLTEFPSFLSDKSGLTELRLARNPLEWPDSLKGFAHLEYLDLWDTDISTVPVYVEGFDQLREIDLRETYLDESNRQELEELFPDVEIHLSQRCNCLPKK